MANYEQKYIIQILIQKVVLYYINKDKDEFNAEEIVVMVIILFQTV